MTPKEEAQESVCPKCGSSYIKYKEDMRLEIVALRTENERLTADVHQAVDYATKSMYERDALRERLASLLEGPPVD